MTVVKIRAHCELGREVVVSVVDEGIDEQIVLTTGEILERSVSGDTRLVVEEREKEE